MSAVAPNAWPFCGEILAPDLSSPRPFQHRGRLPLLPTRSGEQRLFDDHQIGQGEQRMELCGVLLEAAIAQLLMAKAVLDDVEGMLDHGPHLRERPLDRLRQLAQRCRQSLDDAALDRDVPQPAPAKAGDTSRSTSSGRLSAPV